MQQALLKILEGTRGLCAAAGRAQASAPGVHPDRHDEHPVHLRWRVRRPRKDHRERIGHKGVGFHGTVRSTADKDPGELFAQVLPEDLLKFGMIPEFIGRLPMVGAVRSLDREALVQILVEPKNALVKQYQKFFELEDVELEFTTDAPRRRSPIRHCCVAPAPAAAGHPRRGAAQHDVRPARPQRRRQGRHRRRRRCATKVNPTLVPRRGTPAQGCP